MELIKITNVNATLSFVVKFVFIDSSSIPELFYINRNTELLSLDTTLIFLNYDNSPLE